MGWVASAEQLIAPQDPALLKTLRSPTFQPLPSQCSGLFTGSSMPPSAGSECPFSTPRPLRSSPLRWTGVWTTSHLGKRRCLRNKGSRVFFMYLPSITWVGLGPELPLTEAARTTSS